MLPTNSPRRDLHAEITDQLISAIECRPGTFTLPWRREAGPLHLPANAITASPYSGINILSLWVAAARSNFVQPIWATYRQWAELGAQVRKGERASTVIFYREYDAEPDPTDAEDNGRRRVARASAVFNVAQVDGFIAPTSPTPPPANGRVDQLAAVDHFISGTGADIRLGGDRAYYDRHDDRIQLPDQDRFVGTDTSTATEAFYSTALHELVHWSGAQHRLDRTFGERFGDLAYAAEELAAEIGAAFLCAELQISQAVRLDHAQYLAAWVQLLKHDKRAIFVAAARASEVARFLKRCSSGIQQEAGSVSKRPTKRVPHSALPTSRPLR